MAFCGFEISAKPKALQLLENPTSIGEHLKKRRIELSLKQLDVAQILGVTEDCMTNWENERFEPQINYYTKILQFLGYNPFPIDESTLGGRIRKYRIEHGLSHNAFGKLIGVDASTIGSWEKNITVPKKVKYEKLMGLLMGRFNNL